jgi:hypothetical protein
LNLGGSEDIAFVNMGAIDRLTEVLTLRNADQPEPGREVAISDLQVVRKLLMRCALPITDDGDAAARVLFLLDQLGMLERTSLGTAPARQKRASATASHIADILIRHHELSFGGARRPIGRHVLPSGLGPAPARLSGADSEAAGRPAGLQD